MSGRLPDALAGIKQAIDEGIAASETRLAATGEQLRALLADLEQRRTELRSLAEERELDRLLGRAAPQEPGNGTAELRQSEDELAREYSRALVLSRQLADFSHLLASSRQQFRDEGALPGADDAQRLVIRQVSIRAQEDERRRLAREVHDGPAQVLANAIIGLEFIERSLRQTAAGGDAAIQEIDRIKAAMREGLTEIRRFIFDLRPTMLSQRGLGATVAHYVETYRSIFSSDVDLEVDEDLPRLTPDQELTAFRVIQESLQNAQRHARPAKIGVTITTNPDGLIVRVRDNGKGFRPSAVHPSASGGQGLLGMRERAEVIGGRLHVRSAPGKGTDIMLVIPLTNPKQTTSDESCGAGATAEGGRS